MAEDAGNRRRKGQSKEDRLREVKDEKNWIDTSLPDWKERLSSRMNKGDIEDV